jgi:integrase
LAYSDSPAASRPSSGVRYIVIRTTRPSRNSIRYPPSEVTSTLLAAASHRGADRDRGQGRVGPRDPTHLAVRLLPELVDPFVFHSPRGKPLLKGTHAWSWQKVRAAAGVNCRWHDLRHFCATQLLELGLDHFAVSIQLGHTDGGALVMERYGHPSEDAAKQRLLQAFSFDGVEGGSGLVAGGAES